MFGNQQRVAQALVAVVVLAATPLWARRPETGFLNRTAVVAGVTYRYQVYLPNNWNKKTKWPVVLFLHGSGERGEDGLVQTDVGIGTAIRKHVDRFPFVVVMPQCRKKASWTSDAMMAQALKALDQSIKEFKGDPQRIYLTGLSMGGFGTWAIGAKYPGRFAALVPVCGGIRMRRRDAAASPPKEDAADPYATTAERIGKTPVWVFHGADDPTVPVTESRQMVAALKAAGGNVRYTEYPGVKHNSWENAYAEPDLFTWLLAQTLAPAPTK